MSQHSMFSVKTAVFNAIGFSMFTIGCTYVDGRATSRLVYGARQYPLGYWIALGAPLVAILTFCTVKWIREWRWRSALTAAAIAVPGLISLLNFFPEFPHPGVIWIIVFSIGTLLSCLFRFCPEEETYLKDPVLSEAVRIEYTKEAASSWRWLAFGSAAAYLGLIISWTNVATDLSGRVFSSPSDIELARLHAWTGIAVFSIYVLLGPVLEAATRASRTLRNLLQIKSVARSGVPA